MSCSKKQKTIESDHEIDHISKLPDAMLHHILSFVPTRSAVATSVLSRRWISIWTKVPALNFTKLPMSMSFRDCEKDKFMSFILNVLSHNDIPCLQRFHFDILRDLDIANVSLLIDSILRREIWEICLNKEWDGLDAKLMHLPMDLFARETLRVLKLSGSFEVIVPLSLHLPKLETLCLYELKFVVTDVMEILTSGYPALKELMIEKCTGIDKLCVKSLTLNKLKLHHHGSEIITVDAPNVRYLDLDVDGGIYEVSNFSSLVEARISSSDYKLFRRISNVHTLWLSQSTVALFGYLSENENELPMFPKLTRLEIELEHSMFQMLKYAPKLTHLTVDVGCSLRDHDLPLPYEIVPPCMSSISYIEIRRFHCLENDTELVRYILKNATVLEELKLHMHRASLRHERDAFIKLLGIPRVSFCKVSICSSCGLEILPLEALTSLRSLINNLNNIHSVHLLEHMYHLQHTKQYNLSSLSFTMKKHNINISKLKGEALSTVSTCKVDPLAHCCKIIKSSPDLSVVGPCDGLICMSKDDNRMLYVWDPITK